VVINFLAGSVSCKPTHHAFRLFDFCLLCCRAGKSTPNIPALAAALSSKASSRIALLELLCSTAAPPANAATNTASHQQSQRCAAAAAAAAATADIRRFCGVSELHKAALCIVAAVLRCGDSCWAWQDVLTALDAAVCSAGPGILSQPDLLLQIVLLYCQTEQQLAVDLAQQAVQLGTVLLVDVPQQQQGLGAAGGGSSSSRAVALAAAAAQLPVPGSIMHAVEKLGKSMPNGLQPEHSAAQWIVAHAGQLPGATSVLLQRWLAAILPACVNSSTDSAAAAAAGTGNGNSGAPCTGQTQQQGTSAVGAAVVQQQQQEVCVALVGLLIKFPGALQMAVQLARSCVEAKQQQQQQQQLQLAGWLCILTAALHSLGSSSTGSSSGSSGGCDPSELEYLSYVSLQGTGCNSSSSSVGLQQLLLGPSGVLELCKRSLLAAAGSAGSSWGSTLVLLACNSCLLAAVNATAAAAAAAADEEVGSGVECYNMRHKLEQHLLQYGIQQVGAF
jgi:hypothetical protein